MKGRIKTMKNKFKFLRDWLTCENYYYIVRNYQDTIYMDNISRKSLWLDSMSQFSNYLGYQIAGGRLDVKFY